MEKPVTVSSLEKIRSEIDAVDEAMLRLLEQRFAAIKTIKSAKQHASGPASPMRPAREAEILRRLFRLRQGAVPAQLVVRLWRSMISEATRLQADVIVHVAEDISTAPSLRDLVRDHYPGLPIRQGADVKAVVEAATRRTSDVGVVRTMSNWIGPLLESSGLKVIGMLPVMGRRNEVPPLLVLGHAAAEPSDDDETLVAIQGKHRAQEGELWAVQAGSYSCVALGGFLEEKSAEIARVKSSHPDAAIVGRLPSPLEALS